MRCASGQRIVSYAVYGSHLSAAPQYVKRGIVKMEKKKLPFSEKLGYVGASVAMSVVLVFVPNFINIYYTDVVGLSASTVGFIILICKVTDGISDIIMGMIIDRTNTKWGKARPWILAGGIGSAVSLYLLFNAPASFSQTGLIAFCVATYFLVCPFFGTIIGVAQTAIIPKISSDEKQRTILGLIHSFSLIVVTILVAMATPILISMMGESRETYQLISAGYAILTIVSAVMAFVLVREHTGKNSEDSTGKTSIRETFKLLGKNKHFIFLALGSIFYNTSLVSGATTYYAKYILGDVGYVALFTLCTGGSYFLLFFSLQFRKRFSIRSMLVVGFIISAVGCGIIWFAYTNIVLLGIGTVLRGVGILPLLAYSAPLTGEISDYTLYQTRKNMDGVIFSGFSMGGKIGTGLGAALVGWLIGAFHYDGMAAVQTDSALLAIRLSNSVLPLIFCILSAVCFSFITVEKEKEPVQKALKERGLR